MMLIYWDFKRKDCTRCAWDIPSQRRNEYHMNNSNNHIYWINAINTAYARNLTDKSVFEKMLEENGSN